jgi:hypothetical protein
MQRPPLTGSLISDAKAWAVWLEWLRADQAASGLPTFTCPTCGTPSRYGMSEIVACEGCDRLMGAALQPDGGWLISPLDAGSAFA